MKRISSINDLIDWNIFHTGNGSNEKRFLFRGVTDSDHLLIPKLYRRENTNEIVSDESATIRENILKDYLKIHLPGYGYDFHNYEKTHQEWKEVFMAQHYGVPTNLLDFTRNPLVAAFFAVNKNSTKDGVIYAVQIQEQDWQKSKFDASLNDYNIASYDLLSSSNEKVGPYDLDRPIFVVPPHIDERIKAQIGVFCCFPRTKPPKPLDTLAGFADKKDGEAGRIHKLIIDGSIKPQIMDELNKVGVNDISLFPDMNGFGQFVSRRLFRHDEKGILNKGATTPP